MLSLLQAYSTYSTYSYPRTTSTYSTYSSSSSAAETGILAAVAGVGIFAWLIGMVICILVIVAMWKIFTKAGEAGWKAIIPIYNAIVMCQIVGLNPLMILLVLIPGVGSLIFSILLAINLAKAFGKGGGFIAGLILLAPIFYMILGFGKAQYDPSVRVQNTPPQGPQQPPEQPMQ